MSFNTHSSQFNYVNQQLHVEDVSLLKIIENHGAPLFVYSKKEMEQRWQEFEQAFVRHNQNHLICYSVKANSNIAILNILAKLGSGFDIVSQGELERILAAKADPKKVVFSGVGKQIEEIKKALEVGIKCFNIESESELNRIQTIAKKMDIVTPVSIRVNPNVDAKTHPYIATGLKDNKFGVDIEIALNLYKKASEYSHINIIGIDCHIGSQITDLEPFVESVKQVIILKNKLQKIGIEVEHLDFGGGLGIQYGNEPSINIADYVQTLIKQLNDSNVEIIIEPGRSIVGNSGILLSKIEYLKSSRHKNFAIVNAAMNDLIRPALYKGYHDILPVVLHNRNNTKLWDVVGPVCETGDLLGEKRQLDLQEGDLLAIMSAGAYAYTMSSNYNSRPKLAEVLVDGSKTYVIRSSENIDELFSKETII